MKGRQDNPIFSLCLASIEPKSTRRDAGARYLSYTVTNLHCPGILQENQFHCQLRAFPRRCFAKDVHERVPDSLVAQAQLLRNLLVAHSECDQLGNLPFASSDDRVDIHGGFYLSGINCEALLGHQPSCLAKR